MIVTGTDPQSSRRSSLHHIPNAVPRGEREARVPGPGGRPETYR
jgi:hypothetical protein